ncbi:hypothetical protein B0A48_14847 [Cryoendolithus antarcticus]|uniref:Uncharacterized protein n=1 Tax=Cryoendolithus antarcticus TaxID=1507870 RepID=A0A1V8SIW6_9PEZI|nr:hypothetical protein B0A48_14847 [Cryoendolithus antarcticus]
MDKMHDMRLPPFRAHDVPSHPYPQVNPYPPVSQYNAGWPSSSSYRSQQQQPHYKQQPYSMLMDSSAPEESAPLTGDSSFDVLDWHPAYQSCQRYFLDYAQHEAGTQALCALINIKLPHQWLTTPVPCSNPASNGASSSHSSANQFTFTSALPRGSANGAGVSSPSSRSGPRSGGPRDPPIFISLVPYIRRLVVTGFDKPPILHGFFGDDYARGILPHVECERRNYLFAAKHGGWRTCKKQYDGGSQEGGVDETVPFMKPLTDSKRDEMDAADKAWSSWLAMEDWMVGPRAVDGERERKRERDEREEEGYHRR